MYSKDTEHWGTGQVQTPTNITARQSRALSPSMKPQSPVLRPDSTVMSEERGTSVPNNEHDATQPTCRLSASDSLSALSTTQSQRPSVWNPFLAGASTAVSRSPGTDSESEHRTSDSATAKATKHSRASDDDTHSTAKKRKTNSEVYNGSSRAVELAGSSVRPSGQSPSSSTLDANAGQASTTTQNGDSAASDAHGVGAGGGECAPDSSCDEQSTTPNVKRFDVIAKDTNKPAVQTDLTVVDVVHETASLVGLPLQASQ